MKQTIKLLFLFLLTAFIISCEKDIIAKDITGKSVTVLAPADNTTTPINGITFWWEKVDGAEKYNVQIVSPSFSNIVQLVVDTNVTGDKFTRSLQPGTYQWRIRATNNAGSTPWITRNLTIDSTTNLSLITVGLNSPADSLYTNIATQSLSWYAVNAADEYDLKVYNINTPSVFVHDGEQVTTSATVSFPSDGTYIWKVQARNNYSISAYSQRKIFIDQTAPAAPSPVLPANTTGSQTISTAHLLDSLQWSRDVGVYYDSLFVSRDSVFSITNVFVHTKITGAAVYQITGAAGFTTGQIYYWKMKSFDKAGNVSAFSTRARFKVN